jgi:predicted alpha/beta-hydrolase family hydrolase
MELATLGAVGYKAPAASDALLVLAHGAGAGQQHPFVTAVASGFAARGIDVVTFDFPYMREHRKVPDKSPVLERAFGEVLTAAREWSSAARCIIGGKSMGGRIATHLGAAHVDGVSGIVVFGYPLHPPGKPDQLRVAHLGSIAVPVLIIQGERDAFGTPKELEQAIETMTADVTLHVVAKGDHSLSVPGRRRDEILDEVLDVAASWIRAGSDPFTK